MTGLIYLLIFAHLGLIVKPVRGNFRLQILHNNDLHAHFVETDAYSASCPDEFVKENKCFGGFARMKQAADEARLEANKQNIPSIFLNGGDSFQGTPYYTLYKWQVVAPLINSMGFDVMALGNHEFDDGIDNLVNYLRNVQTPVVCSNLNLTSEKRLDLPILTPSVVLDVQGKKIGVVGYLTPDTMDIANTENLQIFPEMPYIRAEAQRLKSKGVNIIIALGHSGFEFDVKLAQQVEEISVVVGAHSHSLLYTPKDHPPSTEYVVSEYPTMVTQKSGKVVPVVQAYAYCKYLGRLIVEFDDNGNVKSATGNTKLLDGQVKKEPKLDAEISKWENNIRAQITVVKGYTRTFLAKPNFDEGNFESNLANLITDSFIDIGVLLSQESKLPTWTRAPIAFYQSGGIRTQLDNKKNEGALTYEDLMTVLPFDNKLVEIALNGSTIKKALEFSVSAYDSTATDFYARRVRYYLHFSGLKVSYDLTKPAGNRIKSVDVLCTECSIPRFVPLQDDKTYRVITVSFLADGGDKYDMLKNERVGKITVLRLTDLDAVVRYVEKNRIVYPKQDNRVSVIGFSPLKSTSSASSRTPSTISLYVLALLPLLRLWLS